MPQDKLSKEDESFLEKFQDETTKTFQVNSTRQLFYHSAAFLTSLLPLFLFRGVYSLDIDGINLIPYLGVCVGAAYLLSNSYHQIFVQKMNKMNTKFLEEYRVEASTVSKQEKQELMTKKDQIVEMGATAYSMLFINCAFVILVMFFGLYMMKQVDVRLRFMLSLGVSAFCCNWISRREGRVRKSKDE